MYNFVERTNREAGGGQYVFLTALRRCKNINLPGMRNHDIIKKEVEQILDGKIQALSRYLNQ